MEAGKRQAMAVPSNWGFRVEQVPVADGRTADLRVSDDGSSAILKEHAYVSLRARLSIVVTVELEEPM